jgi:hypothetical protein
MEKELTPHDYFLQLKSNVESISNEKLKQSFNNICFLSEKYKKVTGADEYGISSSSYHTECSELF